MKQNNTTTLDLASEDLITEAQAAKLLGIHTRTLRNKVHLGVLPKDTYITLITGKRRFFKSRLLVQA